MNVKFTTHYVTYVHLMINNPLSTTIKDKVQCLLVFLCNDYNLLVLILLALHNTNIYMYLRLWNGNRILYFI